MGPFMRILILFLIMVTAMLYKRLSDSLISLPPPELSYNEWWGDNEKPKDWNAYLENTSAIIGNRINYPEETIQDLFAQLKRPLRLTEPLEGIGFEYGFNSKELRLIIDYWRDDYLPRWRERELFLWQFNHFTTEIQGLQIHFLHPMVYDEDKIGRHFYPVLLLHGWPGSVREFYTLIHKLHQTNKDPNNKYIFNVVVPSLPGFGWSQGTSKTGLGPAQMAVIMRNLMLKLGYDKFFVQGGDWGSLIGSHMATLFPENVLGYHSNLCAVLNFRSIVRRTIATVLPSFFIPKEHYTMFSSLSKGFEYIIEESGYHHLQSTKPDTIGSVLTDNPVGLAAYILEKFSTWTNENYRKLNDGGLTDRFTLDTLLDNIMIYYLTNSIMTSQRIYAESQSKAEKVLYLDRVPTEVPTGCARFKHDIMHFLDYQLKDKYLNLIHSTYHNKGGHFAAMEVPETLYDDFIEFVKKVEKFSKLK